MGKLEKQNAHTLIENLIIILIKDIILFLFPVWFFISFIKVSFMYNKLQPLKVYSRMSFERCRQPEILCKNHKNSAITYESKVLSCFFAFDPSFLLLLAPSKQQSHSCHSWLISFPRIYINGILLYVPCVPRLFHSA